MMNKMLVSLNNILKNKNIVKIISLLLAIILWFSITLLENPYFERVLSSVDIYLDTKGTVVEEQGLSIINLDDAIQQVSVKVSGASYVVNSLSSEDILVTPLFDGINASGKKTVKIDVKNNSSKNFTIESVTPETVDLEFDYIDKITYDLQIRVKGITAKVGLTLGSPRFTNSDTASIKVEGPRSIVSTIKTAYAEVSQKKGTQINTTKSYDAAIKFYDENEKKVSSKNLTLEFDKISVSLPVYKTKSVDLVPSFLNKPEDFDLNSTITIDEKELSEIDIEGIPDIIDKTTKIELEPIDFKEVNAKTKEFKKKIILPSGVSSVDELSEVTVKIDTSNLKSKTFTIGSVVAKNNENNYKVSLINPLKIKICGHKDTISSLSSKDLYLSVDLDGKLTGEQNIEVTVKSKQKDNIWQIGQQYAKIKVS